jgi:hypothetical protein
LKNNKILKFFGIFYFTFTLPSFNKNFTVLNKIEKVVSGWEGWCKRKHRGQNCESTSVNEYLYS